MSDLKKVYQSVTEEEALSNLMAFKEAWGKQYPSLAILRLFSRGFCLVLLLPLSFFADHLILLLAFASPPFVSLYHVRYILLIRVKIWEGNWDILSTFYAYPPEIRKIIYTTNIIEGLNRQFRKITKNKPSFTNDDSLRKILYLASKNIVEHWTARCRNWDQVISQLEILFGDRQAG